MIGYIVYGYQVLENDINESTIIKLTNPDEECIATGSYLHKLYRTKKTAYEEVKRQYLKQKEDLEKKLNEIEQTLKEIENDK